MSDQSAASVPLMQAPGVHHRRVGDLVITAINDGVISLGADTMVGAEPAQIEAAMSDAFRTLPHTSSINAFVMRGGGRTVLVDTGVGDLIGPSGGHLSANLAAAGVTPEDVTAVAMTHLHLDHLGGLLDANGRPVFANAELVVSEAEIAFWSDDANMAGFPEDRKGFFTLARNALTAYGDRVRGVSKGEIAPGVEAHPLPGHTPGHTGYRVGAGADGLFIFGDTFHIPPVQSRHPEVGVVFDVDPAQAIATRRRILDMVASERLMVAGMHVDFPAFSYIAKASAGYSVVPASYQVTV